MRTKPDPDGKDDPGTRRRAVIRWVAALAAGFCVWAVFSWPVPRFFASGIPWSHRTDEARTDRALVPGDHLQLLYHFWLARDMAAGHTPAFANIYEFNADSTDPAEEVRRVRRFDPYYAPFSWIYAAVSPWAGDAAGWNAAALASVLLGVLGLFALARRHTVSTASALVAATVAAAFPYRWITLLAGSPTGLAMGLAPFVPLGLDIAIRDRRAAGGWMAGAALAAAYCADLHVFYFSALSAPLWGLFSWLCGRPPSRDPRTPSRLGSILPAARALAPAAGIVLLVALAAAWMNRRFAGTDMAGGRLWKEVALFSPRPAGLFSRGMKGMSCHLFATVSLAVLLAGGLVCALVRPRDVSGSTRRTRADVRVLGALMLAAMAGASLLAMGAYGPFGGAAMKLARMAVPKYTMIRQPVKVFCLMPQLVAVALALLLPLRRRAGLFLAALLLAALSLAESKSVLRPAICLLRDGRAAYRAIAADAAARGRTAHALALPIWPGDSHWSSVCQLGAMDTRVRLVNGYSPARDDAYVENVFRAYESANEGFLSDGQADRLLASGVGYVVLHEDAFPEKVSPWPASTTLRRLFANPRLRPLPHDPGTTAWAFRIAPSGEAPSGPAAPRLWTQTVLSAATGCRKKSPGDPPPARDSSGGYVFPAADLFHAGETVPGDGSVRLEPDRDPAGAVVYGPNRAVAPGRYSGELRFEAGAGVPSGMELGALELRAGDGCLARVPVVAGEPCRTPPVALDGSPVRFEFHYGRGAPVRLSAFVLAPGP